MNSKVESQDTQQNPNNSLRPMSSIFRNVFQTMNRAKKETAKSQWIWYLRFCMLEMLELLFLTDATIQTSQITWTRNILLWLKHKGHRHSNIYQPNLFSFAMQSHPNRVLETHFEVFSLLNLSPLQCHACHWHVPSYGYFSALRFYYHYVYYLY